MKEILFKAKRIDNGEWVEGFYINLGNKYHYIIAGGLDTTSCYPDLVKYSVGPETICQYTGLTDKNGNKIWENDVVNHYSYIKGKEYKRNEVVKYIKGGFTTNNYDSLYFNSERNYVVVIGNIFDNPELLKAGD